MKKIASALNHAMHLESPSEAVAYVTGAVVAQLQRALELHEEVGMIVAGGTTYLPVYEKLAKAKLPWDRVMLFHTDARCVPDGDPDSSNTLIDDWLAKFPAKKKPQFTRALHLENQDAAAGYYEGRLHEWMMRRPIALCLVGVGKDGHIASIFPGGMDAIPEDRLVIPTGPEMEPRVDRISLTPHALACADMTYSLVMGPDKMQVLDRAAAGEALPVDLLPENTHFVLCASTK